MPEETAAEKKIRKKKVAARKTLKTKLQKMNKMIAEAIKLFKSKKPVDRAKAGKLLQEVEVMKKALIMEEFVILINLSFASIYWELVSMNLQLDLAIYGINSGNRTDKEILDYMKGAKKDKELLEMTTKHL